MTTTTATDTRYYVARLVGVSSVGQIQRCQSLAHAKDFANYLYRNGVVAPVVVAAADIAVAREKAEKVARGAMTTRQAAR